MYQLTGIYFKSKKHQKMKTLFTLLMVILIAITGIVSARLFMHFHYNFSALLTLTSVLSIIFCVNILSNKKVILS